MVNRCRQLATAQVTARSRMMRHRVTIRAQSARRIRDRYHGRARQHGLLKVFGVRRAKLCRIDNMPASGWHQAKAKQCAVVQKIGRLFS